MFDFLSMADNYEDRVVANYKDEKTGLCVDTSMVTDSDKDYETGIEHPCYNDGDWVIVELYDTKEKAQKGHNNWVKKMTGKELPKQLRDVSSCTMAKLVFSGLDDKDRINKRK